VDRVAAPVRAGRADLVLGTRRPVGRRAWPAHARVANRVLAGVLRRRAGLVLADLGPLRVARRAELVALEVSDRGSGWPLEMVLRAARSGWTVAEVPVDYRRRAGRSKVTGTLAGTIGAVRDMRRVLATTAVPVGPATPVRDGGEGGR
jgi:hypothetical protein